MEGKNLNGAGKREARNGDDRAPITKTIFSEFQETHSVYEDLSVQMGERSRFRRKRKETPNNYESEEGCSRNNYDHVQRLSLSKKIKKEEGCSYDNSKFECLLEAASLFSEYEEARNRRNLRNNASVDDEEEDDEKEDDEKEDDGDDDDEGDGSGEVLPRELQEKIEELDGHEIKYVTQKTLFSTDLNPKHARLSIPPTKIANRFLSRTEELSLDECIKENGKLAGLSVTVLDPSLKEYNMCLKKWNMKKSYVYNLTKGWNQIVRGNHLKLHDMLHLWSFRVSSQLCFALVKI